MKKRPRILVTRFPHQASALADRLRALGAEPVLIPTIELTTPTSYAALDVALQTLLTSQPASFHWMLFTSANAVEAFARRWKEASGTIPLPTQTHIASIGPATTMALAVAGMKVDLTPPAAIAESLADALLPHTRQPDGTPTRFLLIRAEDAREYLPETLRAAGADVTVAPAYRNVVPPGSVAALRSLFQTDPPDAITFTSSSTATNFFSLLTAARIVLPSEVVLASIGPVTSATVRSLGYEASVEAPEASTASLAETVVEFFALRKPRKEQGQP